MSKTHAGYGYAIPHAHKVRAAGAHLYSLVGLMVYKRPHFRPIAKASELPWRLEGTRPTSGILFRVFTL
jgi:hypothetical protein